MVHHRRIGPDYVNQRKKVHMVRINVQNKKKQLPHVHETAGTRNFVVANEDKLTTRLAKKGKLTTPFGHTPNVYAELGTFGIF